MPGRSAVERSFFFTISRRVKIYGPPQAGASQYDTRVISGYCFCNALVANWLDIPANVGLPPSGEDAQLSVSASTRTLEVVGGGTGSSNVQEHTRSRGYGGKQGSKTVIIKTGKATVANGTRKATISFRFPSWCKASDIADILGEIIPASKIQSVPGMTEIRDEFQIRGGKRYKLVPSATAQASPSPAVPESQAESDTAGQASKEGRGKAN